MGFKFLQVKALLEKQTRERRRREKLAPKGELFTRLVPQDSSVRFRCQVLPNTEHPKVGDKLLLFRDGTGTVKALKQLKQIGDLLPEAAADLEASFCDQEASEIHLAEVVTEPDPLDETFDLVVRPPWDDLPASK